MGTANKKNVSDEQIVSALMSTPTMKEAAEMVGISTRALYDRMSDGEFQGLYKAAKAELMRRTVMDLNNKIGVAIETIVQIMDDENVNPAVRLQAAQTIMNNAGKFTERLQATETEQIRQQEANSCSFGFWK